MSFNYDDFLWADHLPVHVKAVLRGAPQITDDNYKHFDPIMGLALEESFGLMSPYTPNMSILQDFIKSNLSKGGLTMRQRRAAANIARIILVDGCPDAGEPVLVDSLYDPLNDHLRDRHACSRCGLVFSSSVAVGRHIVVVHESVRFAAAPATLPVSSAAIAADPLFAPAEEMIHKVNLGNVPDGRFALVLASGETKFYIKRTVKRPYTRHARFRWSKYNTRWEKVPTGTQEVRELVGDTKELIGEQAIGTGLYVGEQEDQIAEIAADPVEALVRYGKLIGACGYCGRTLTDEQSRADGVGPECFETKHLPAIKPQARREARSRS